MGSIQPQGGLKLADLPPEGLPVGLGHDFSAEPPSEPQQAHPIPMVGAGHRRPLLGIRFLRRDAAPTPHLNFWTLL